MWKIFAAFIVFALGALFVIMKGGDKIDMQGEAGHGVPSSSAPHDASTTAATPPVPGAPTTGAPATPATSTPPASGAAPAASK